MPPFFVDLVLEGELNVAAAYLTSVDEEQRDLVRCKRFFADYVIEDGLGFVVGVCSESLLREGLLHGCALIDDCRDRCWGNPFVDEFRVAPMLIIVAKIYGPDFLLGAFDQDLPELKHLLDLSILKTQLQLLLSRSKTYVHLQLYLLAIHHSFL